MATIEAMVESRVAGHLERNVSELDLLKEISELLADRTGLCQTVRDTLTQVLRRLERQPGCGDAILMLRLGNKGERCVGSVRGWATCGRRNDSGAQPDNSEQLADAVCRTGRGATVRLDEDVSRGRDEASSWDLAGPHAVYLVCVPVIVKSRVIGSLAARIDGRLAGRRGEWLEGVVCLLSTVANMVACVVRSESLALPESTDDEDAAASGPLARSGFPSLRDRVDSLERQMICDALRATRGNVAAAARVLSITPRIIRYKIKKLGIDTRHP